MIQQNDKLTKSLLKKAMGYSVDEVVEEYVNDDQNGEMKLLKKKITTKHIPPDISAARALLEKCFDNEFEHLKDLSDEELNELKQEIIKEIQLKGGVK